MTDALDKVRATLSNVEDVDLPEGMTAPHPDADEGHPDSDPYEGMEPDFTPRGVEDGAREVTQDQSPLPFWRFEENDPEDPRPPVQRAADQALNDVGNGQRFAIHFGRDVIFVPRVGWFVWTGQVWKKDEDRLAVRALAQKIGPLVEAETQFITVGDEEAAQLARRDALVAVIGPLSDIPANKRKVEERAQLREAKGELATLDALLDKIGGQIGQRLRHAKAAGNSASVENMLLEASVSLAVPLEMLDSEPMAINTESGILRLTVGPDPFTGKGLLAQAVMWRHDRAALMTKLMPVRWHAKAKPTAAAFAKFFERIQPDAMIRAFLQRWFGLSMTGRPVQFLCFFYGDGNNGKSVLVDLMCSVFGTYATTANVKSLTGEDRRDGAAATPDLVPLIGARFVRASEPKRGDPWQEDVIKQMTGGEKMMIRPLFGAAVEAIPFFKLNISGNDKPEIRGTDEGIWRRLRIVPFDVQIPKEELIPKDQLDPMLFAERDGVFAWAVQGLLDYLEHGLQEPQIVLNTTQDLRAENDLYGAFLDDCCLVTGEPGDRIATPELVNAFHYWMALGKRGVFKDQTVSRALAKASRHYRSSRTGQKFTALKSAGKMGYLGIQFQPLFGRKFKDAKRDNSGRPIVLREDNAHWDGDDTQSEWGQS